MANFSSSDEILRLVAAMERAKASGFTADEERKIAIAKAITADVRKAFNTHAAHTELTNGEVLNLFAIHLAGVIKNIFKNDKEAQLAEAIRLGIFIFNLVSGDEKP